MLFLLTRKPGWVFWKIGVGPPNHPFVHRVFHYFHHPFWGTLIFGNTPCWLSGITPPDSTNLDWVDVFSSSIFQFGCCLNPKGWCFFGTPYHPWNAPLGRSSYSILILSYLFKRCQCSEETHKDRVSMKMKGTKKKPVHQHEWHETRKKMAQQKQEKTHTSEPNSSI